MLALLLAGSSNAATDYRIETVATGLDFPWNIAFLPNGDRLVTELGGQLRRITPDDTVGPPIDGVPPVYRMSQGGLFDVLPDPDFSDNQWVYLSFAAGEPKSNATTVARARLAGNTLTDLTVLFSATPKKTTAVHYGGRLAWLHDGTLLLTTGDGWEYREKAQGLETHFGKTIRMNKDGSPATGNPFPEAPYVWTYGHRNPQGLAVSRSGVVYSHEHGPRGGDEVNVLVPGNNYGWPAITYGIDYNGAYVSPFTEAPGMQQPIHVWTPSIAPSGLMIYEGELFPEWRGDLFVSALVNNEVRRLQLKDGQVVAEEALFAELATRVRDVRQAPDGSIYILTDGKGDTADSKAGQVLRVVPAD
jgi:glucose/arabinose dehydrogenase